MDALDEIRFLMQTHTDAQRTLICEPDRVHAVRAAVDQAGAASTFTVQGSPVCPPGRILVVDEQALEASWRKTVQSFARGIRVSGRATIPLATNNVPSVEGSPEAGRPAVKKAWRAYWQWYGIGYGVFQASMAAVLAVSGLLLLAVPLAWMAFGPDLGLGFPWR